MSVTYKEYLQKSGCSLNKVLLTSVVYFGQQIAAPQNAYWSKSKLQHFHPICIKWEEKRRENIIKAEKHLYHQKGLNGLITMHYSDLRLIHHCLHKKISKFSAKNLMLTVRCLLSFLPFTVFKLCSTCRKFSI